MPVTTDRQHRSSVQFPERPTWPGAGTSPALFLNTRGGRLSVRAASGIIATIAENARLDDETTAHILRHTFATTLVRGKTDLVVVAELMGHTRLETTLPGLRRPGTVLGQF